MPDSLQNMNAAAVRAFHVANNIPIGSRGAPNYSAYQRFFQAQMGGQRKPIGLSAAGLALSLGLPLLRLAADRRARQQR